MQAAAAVCLPGPSPFKGTKSLVTRRSSSRPCRTVLCPRAMASATPETSTVDYSSSSSVFPAEACETIGGEACDVEMFPEVKPAAPASNTGAKASSEEVEREYVEYNEPKTVFPGEACDDLGGEFCEPEYQKGVYEDTAQIKE
ncbi:light-regulated protein, chloroplastic-like [Phoenix dactylifera]|uniref:Light-regulated protein, chloroplastic-like n=1 Tax=Phoenix dactylifera TaxID=42345 RepID=A0A8B7C341_PHODC|nr:light-regulated protein, chloroplastic-like [Phoenix dactylifera]